MTVEEDLRATFARHESETPAAGPLRDKIKAAVVRRKRRRAITATAAAVLAVVAAFPVALNAARPDPVSPLALIGTAPSTAPVPQTGANFLLIATDEGLRSGEPKAIAITVVHLSADLTSMYLVSLPRTGVVAGDSLAGSFARGGKEATARKVADLTGLALDVTATVEPAELHAAIDAAGGYTSCTTMKSCRRQSGSDAVKRLRSDGTAAESFLQMVAVRLAPIKNVAALEHVAGAAAKAGGRDPEALSSLLAMVRSVPGAGSMPAPKIRVIRPFDPASPTDVYAKAGPSLYEALRNDDLQAWAAGHPDYVIVG